VTPLETDPRSIDAAQPVAPILPARRARFTSIIARYLPISARPEPTILHYVLLRATRQQHRIARGLSFLSAIASVIILLTIGYWLSTLSGHRTLLDSFNPLDTLYLVVFWPLAAIQIGTRLAALVTTASIASSEIRRGTWETLRSTTNGAASTVRMHFLAVFYRLRPLLIGLLALRVLFIVGMLINFTAFNGSYLDNMIGGTLPFDIAGVPAFVRTGAAVLLLAFGMVACVLLPFSALAFDAALGTLLSTYARRNWLGILIQTALLFGRLLLSMLALWIGALAIFGSDQVLSVPGAHLAPTVSSNLIRWVGALFGLAEGDWGLTFVHQAHTQVLWTDVRDGILINGAVLIYALGQLALAARILNFAIRRAERPAVQ